MRSRLAALVVVSLFSFMGIFLAMAEEHALDGKPCQEEERVSWLPYETAMKTARESKLPVVLVFWRPNCRACDLLDKYGFDDPAVACYLNRKFAASRINTAERADIKARYRVAATPTVWILDHEGKEIDYFTGYIKAEKLLVILRYVGEGAYREMDFNEFERREKSKK